LEQAAGTRADEAWLAHLRLFATYFEYLLRRLELLTEMQALVSANRDTGALPQAARTQLLQREQVHLAVQELRCG
jgi:hypothetical protein